MEDSSSQNGSWPFSVRYTASPYRKAQSGKVVPNNSPSSASSYTTNSHGHFDPNGFHHHSGHQVQNVNMINMNQHLHFLQQQQQQQNAHQQQQQQQHLHPQQPHHVISMKQKHLEVGGGFQHFHNNHHSTNGQNHFLDLKQHHQHQQNLIHYRQRQYDHHHYGLPLNLNVAALPPEVILQASQATMTKTMDMDLQQRFENFQNFQNLESMQQIPMQTAQNFAHHNQTQYNPEKGELMKNKNSQRIEENHHFRMRYPPITPRNRVLKLSGNCSSLEQVKN
jgi:hypothetical protein